MDALSEEEASLMLQAHSSRKSHMSIDGKDDSGRRRQEILRGRAQTISAENALQWIISIDSISACRRCNRFRPLSAPCRNYAYAAHFAQGHARAFHPAKGKLRPAANGGRIGDTSLDAIDESKYLGGVRMGRHVRLACDFSSYA